MVYPPLLCELRIFLHFPLLIDFVSMKNDTRNAAAKDECTVSLRRTYVRARLKHTTALFFCFLSLFYELVEKEKSRVT